MMNSIQKFTINANKLDTGLNSFSINLANLSSGVYLIAIEIGSQKITRTIVKN